MPSDNKERILEYLKDKLVSFNVICKDLSLSPGLTSYWLKKLAEEGRIIKLPKAGAGHRAAMVYYKLTNKSKKMI